MKATTVLSVLPIFSGSSLTAPVTGCTPYSIALLTIDSGTDLMYGVVEAQETRFWVGRKTKSYCPLTPADYPAGNESYMSVLDGSSSLSMAVEVPGGQQVFISPKGALRYTDAHSGYVPPGSITSGFSVSHPGGDYVDILSHEGGFFACQVGTGYDYQIFVGVAGFKKTGCSSVGMLAANVTGLGAWQYDGVTHHL